MKRPNDKVITGILDQLSHKLRRIYMKNSIKIFTILLLMFVVISGCSAEKKPNISKSNDNSTYNMMNSSDSSYGMVEMMKTAEVRQAMVEMMRTPEMRQAMVEMMKTPGNAPGHVGSNENNRNESNFERSNE